MNVDTASEILKEHKNLNKWQQSVNFDTGVDIIDLSLCFGPNPTQPTNVRCSPSTYPKHTTFKFDESKYKGEESLPTLIEDLKSACIGCNLHWRKGTVGKIQTFYELRCDHYRLPDKRYLSNFEPGRFSKAGSIVEQNKVTGGYSSFSRMTDYKLRQTSSLNLSPKLGVNHTTKEQRRRTTGSTADLKESRCPMCIRFTRFHSSGCYYLLNKGSNLEHNFHTAMKPEVVKLCDNHLNAEEMDYMKVMYNNGVGVASIGRILTSLSKKRGVKGLYLSQTVCNMTVRLQQTMNELSGIDPKWSVAQKTIHAMNE